MKSESRLNPDKIIDLLINLVPHIKISHHEPGRITLQFSLSGLGVIKNTNFDGFLDTIPGILVTRTKLFSRSVDIEYDQERLPYDLWESLLELRENPDVAVQVRFRLKNLLAH